MNYRLVLEYDGGSFAGFQKQPGKVTIQETLETALSRLFDQPVKIKAASGRTDAGVHAEGQVINFFAPRKLKNVQILRGLNRYLPPAMAVIKIAKANPDFHARFSAKRKTYEYRIWNHPVRSPLRASFTAWVPYPLDIQKMRRAVRWIKGKHDFRSFCATDAGRKNQDTVRTVFRCDLKKSGAMLILTIEADGFLYHMVRNIAGTLLEVGRGKIAPDQVRRILKARDRKGAGMTAPASGLSLKRVTY